MKEHIYQGVIVFLLFTLLVSVIKSHENYMDLLEVNEQTNDLLDEQRDSHEEIVRQWKNSYEELQEDYSDLLEERNKLKKKRVRLPVYDFTESEVYLIAQCVEAEAGYYEGHENSQKYITQVILNRLNSGQFPNSVKDVIYQNNNGIPQFSVAYNGMIEKHSKVQTKTLENVYEVIVHGTNLPKYVLYFYDASVEENWVNTLNTYSTVEGTVFAYENKEVY